MFVSRDRAPHSPEEAFSAKQVELVRAFSPQEVVGPNTRLEREEHLFTLHKPPGRPQLFLTDLSANAALLLHALSSRGLIAAEGGRIEFTELGKGTDIVLGGDLNDRGEGLVELLTAVAWLRRQKAGLTTIAGNHELYLMAILERPLPSITPQWIHTELQRMNDHDVDIAVGRISEDVPRSVYNWLQNNGGLKTVSELGRWYRDGHPQSALGPGNNEERVFSAKMERILSLFPVPSIQPEALHLLLVDAFRAVREPLMTDYLRGLVPLHRHDSILYLHAFLPKTFSKADSFETLSAQVSEEMSRPFGPWDLSLGYSWSAVPRGVRRGEASVNVQRSYLAGHELSGGRLPEVDKYRGFVLDLVCPAPLRKGVAANGIEAVFRGHDPVLRFESERHGIDPDIGEFRLVHCDTESRLCGPDTTSYLYISPEGEVFTHFDPGHAPEVA